MDQEYLDEFWRRSAYETDRVAPPADFPALPDLPLGRYTDPDFFQLEWTLLFGKAWLYAAHESELANVGDYKVCNIMGAAVLVVRSDDGQIRAFYNACRHRGAPVVRSDSGNARLLVCQYHSWSYDLQGCLQRVPDERDFLALQPAERGLPPVHCDQWGGWIFVNLSPEPAKDAVPLHEWLHPLPTLLADLARSPMRMFHTKSAEIRCNWKILAEGFLEVYHARTVHPTTVAPVVDTRGTVISLFNNGHQNMISPVRPGTRNDNREVLPTFEHTPLLFQQMLQPAHGIFPNVISPLDSRGFPFLVFNPLAIDRTKLDIVWFAPEWGDGPMPHQDVWDLRLARFDRVMDEDYLNLEPIQRSMEHAAHGGQVLNYQERRIWHVHAWIDKVIGPDRIAPELRVPDLLAGWVEKM